jgi:hypothetical protein
MLRKLRFLVKNMQNMGFFVKKMAYFSEKIENFCEKSYVGALCLKIFFKHLGQKHKGGPLGKIFRFRGRGNCSDCPHLRA